MRGKQPLDELNTVRVDWKQPCHQTAGCVFTTRMMGPGDRPPAGRRCPSAAATVGTPPWPQPASPAPAKWRSSQWGRGVGEGGPPPPASTLMQQSLYLGKLLRFFFGIALAIAIPLTSVVLPTSPKAPLPRFGAASNATVLN